MVEQLTAEGLSLIEAGSFVSPKWVPQMAGSDEVFRRFTVSPVTTYTAFTPNIQGLQRAIACDVREIAVFAVASDSFSRKNINRSIAKSLQRFASVVAQTQAIGIAVRGYISRVLGAPRRTRLPLVECFDELLAMGCRHCRVDRSIINAFIARKSRR
ncbi:MAG: hypothetical protein OSA42_04495 [Porticoccaceae bacterium]|nr:hypothetical protein [Porticoccaceae bacterium]